MDVNGVYGGTACRGVASGRFSCKPDSIRLQKGAAELPNHKTDFPRNSAAARTGSDGHGSQQLKNQILLSLPRPIRNAVLSKSVFVELPIHSVLNEVGAPIQNAYFINTGLASILNVLQNGKSVEVGLTGKEGFVGVPLIAGFKTSPTRVIMQIAGSALSIAAKDIKAILRDYPALDRSLQRCSQELALQAAQTAACNRVHEIDQRLARWLLMSQDRIGNEVVPLTQEFLAHMLGTRRASVTVAAGMLQKAGLISYVRGQLKIEDRGRLENSVCECYGALKKQMGVWKSESD